MTRSDSHREKSGTNNQVPLDDFSNGTSARTRPLSFDDIMLRRKNKGDTTKQVPCDLGVADIELAPHNPEKAFDFPECRGQKKDVSERMGDKDKPNDSRKVRHRRIEKLVQVTDERSLDPDTMPKNKGDRDVRRHRSSEGKRERGNHGNRKKDGLLTIESDNGPDKRKDRESYKKDRVPERSRVKSEIVKEQPHNEERRVYRKRKTDERMSNDSDNEYKKRNARDVRPSDKLTSRGREKPEKENKHKHKRHHEEEKSRGKITVKKKDSGKKGLEPTGTHLEESRPKRRRSRSKEREKDRGRRSPSQSPRAFKDTLKDRRELGELSSHSTKDRSEREHPDVDKKRISSNGSSSHYRRSGLGGYSPRKRKTAAAAKTPSPTHRSPERRAAGWDFQLVEKESTVAGSVLSNLNTASQNLSFNINEFTSVAPVNPTVVKPVGISLHTLSSQMQAVDFIQLTQATRPMRRLYIENFPASASEKDLIECINKLLLSSGVNYIQGTQPCISCIIHKDKSQALLEFLTPEDASAALSLDGMSFSGSNLKLRRPKDSANVTTGLSDKSVGAVDSISDTVEDSPNKIFIGGISKLFSSRMLLEIARAFGLVKAFHFEFIADISQLCAFLEYVDHSVTSKACAGLNGMKLGGRVLTAVLATPEHVLENVGELPIYRIPEHAKPLLEKPTAVLKLKNMLDTECLSSLSESELEEILEDIRLECSRFGTVKSCNVVKTPNAFSTMEENEIKNTSASTDACDVDLADRSYITKQSGERTYMVGELDRSEPPEAPHALENDSQVLEDNDGRDNYAGMSDLFSRSNETAGLHTSRLVGDSLSDEMIVGDITKDEICEPSSNGEDGSVKEPPNQGNLGGFTGESVNKQNASNIELESKYDIAGSTSMENIETENKPLTEEELKSAEHNAKLVSQNQELKLEENTNSVELANDERKELDAPGEGDRNDISIDLECIFEPGSVFVEYRRAEAACMAAHCLHGRTFDDRVVTVEYVSHDLYQMRFCR